MDMRVGSKHEGGQWTQVWGMDILARCTVGTRLGSAYGGQTICTQALGRQFANGTCILFDQCLLL